MDDRSDHDETGARLSRDPLIGRVLNGAYRITARLGSGGMGAVYRATQLAVERDVAVKVLSGTATTDRRAMVVRFRREARATSQLRHPNTVNVIDFGDDDGLLYLVLELLHGQTLGRLLKSGGPLAPARAASIAIQICGALHEAHQAGIIHRDLKPENVFVSHFEGAGDFAKVMDFGIARLVDDGGPSASVTRSGVIIGTPRYLAPEQALSEPVSPRTDLYALGVMLYEMVSGAPPFKNTTALAVAVRHVSEPPPPLAVPGWPEELTARWQELLSVLLAKSPDERPESALAVSRALEGLRQASVGIGVADDSTEIPPLAAPSTYEGPRSSSSVTVTRSSRRARWWAWSAALLALTAVVVITAMFLEREAPPGPRVAEGEARTTQPAASRPELRSEPPAVAEDIVEAASEDLAPSREAIVLPVEEGDTASDATPETEVAAVEPEASERPPRLVLETRPAGVTVLLDGERICTSPCDITLEPSDEPVVLRLARRGYRSRRVTVSARPGETIRERVALKRKGPNKRKPPKTDPEPPPATLPPLRLESEPSP